MISPTGNIYCDFCGREQAECGPVTANDGMGGRCHTSAVATQEAMDEDSNVLHGRTAHESTVAIRKPAGAGNGYRICADCALRSIASRLGKTEKTLLQHPQSEDCPYRGRRELRDTSPFLPDMLANNAPVKKGENQ